MEQFDGSNKKPTIANVYWVLGSLDAKMDALTNAINNWMTKVMIALIALAGATVGVKLMGTPPTVVISRFVNMFIFLFTASAAFLYRRRMRGWYFFFIYGTGGVIGNLISLIGGEDLTSAIRVPVFVIVNFAVFLFVWRWDSGTEEGESGRGEV